jgi:peptidoglycan L-alanyl-D-glutamate endopeptidase CwlK
MFKFQLSANSLARLKGVDPVLVNIVKEAIGISTVDFLVLEGLRTPERQALLFADGRSRTLKSKHLVGKAVDLAALDEHGKVSWKFDHYIAIAAAMKEAAHLLNVDDLVWGGDWKSFVDGPHFQLGK